MTTTQAEAVIVKKVDRFYCDRALEMFRHMAIGRETVTTVSDLKVAGDWPLRGSIRFVRDADGAVVSLKLNRKSGKWIAKAN